MALYKEDSVAGITYVRAEIISIFNGTDRKTLSINESKVTEYADGSYTAKAEPLPIELDFVPENYAEEFSVTLANGELKTMTFMDVYLILEDLYFHLAAKRDAEATPEEQG